jgi:MinD-like ATPase involved in chromosome partitioning or flagellar assembly
VSVVAVFNVKGGVGKSTLAILLTSALRDMGKETALVEGDPSSPQSELVEGGEGSIPLGEWLVSGSKTAMTIVDLGPGYSEFHLDALAKVDLIVIVSTADPASLMGAVRSTRLALTANPVARFALVVNKVSDKPTGQRVAERLNRSLTRLLSQQFETSFVVPSCPAIARSTLRRQTLVAADPKSKTLAETRAIAQALAEWQSLEVKPQFLPSWRTAGQGQTLRAA